MQRKQVWLGTFDIAEEPAFVYDSATVWLKGAKAVTNFLIEKALPTPAAVVKAVAIDGEPNKSIGSSGDSSEDPHPLPTSELQYGGDETPFDRMVDGDVDIYGLNFELSLCLTDFYWKRHFWEVDFGKWDALIIFCLSPSPTPIFGLPPSAITDAAMPVFHLLIFVRRYRRSSFQIRLLLLSNLPSSILDS
uniref:Pathogenesis-related genes transcriptional activator PTI6-like n=2 Tax=Elaeis guineensis var. tenera TaxID=51953 RepID=A0A8N4IIH2_ELAGV|nr:pathogenesis-related genes transcriptional activator PTI6-like [Elaeis guineensis]